MRRVLFLPNYQFSDVSVEMQPIQSCRLSRRGHEKGYIYCISSILPVLQIELPQKCIRACCIMLGILFFDSFNIFQFNPKTAQAYMQVQAYLMIGDKIFYTRFANKYAQLFQVHLKQYLPFSQRQAAFLPRRGGVLTEAKSLPRQLPWLPRVQLRHCISYDRKYFREILVRT